MSFYETAQEANRRRIGLLLGDLAFAITFVKIAQSTDDDAKAQRYREYAQIGYDVAVRSLNRLRPPAPERQALEAKIAELRLEMKPTDSVLSGSKIV
jgi:hypothetical protein